MDFLSVRYTYDVLREPIDRAVAETLDSGWYLRGDRTVTFERDFAAYCGTRFAVGSSNGLDALYAILAAYGIGPGDEVIVPAHTFIATWLAVSRTGATPVPVDADPATMNMDLGKAAASITGRTRAIIPVHLYGTVTDVVALRRAVAGRDIRIVEDAAQAHGAAIDGVRAGALGDAAAFSFYPGKNLGAFGDAGAVTTDDGELATRVRDLSNYGSPEKYVHDYVGVNARMDEIQAAVLSVKLAVLDEWTRRRQEIARTYDAELKDCAGLTLPELEDDPARQVWHLYVVRTAERDRLAARLEELGVPTIIHYPVPIHRQGAYRALFPDSSFPVAEAISETCLSLPIGPHLTNEEVGRVIDGVRAALR